MPSEAFELSRRAWIAVDERDLDGFLEIVHEDVEFESLVAEAEGGCFHGHDGVRRWVGERRRVARHAPLRAPADA
jgi:ketosteroid isomerase-like protein